MDLALWQFLLVWELVGAKVGQENPMRECSFCLHCAVHLREGSEPGAASFGERGMVFFLVEEVVVDFWDVQMPLLYLGCQKGCLGYSLLFGLKLELPFIYRRL